MLLSLLERLPTSVNDGPFVLTPADISDIEETIAIESISVERRSMVHSFGNVDHLVMRVTRRSASLFGLWLASTFLSRRRNVYRLKLGVDSLGVRLISYEPEKVTHRTSMVPEAFVWNPLEIGVFLKRHRETAEYELPQYFLTDPDGEWNEHGVDRDTLWITGQGRAVSFLAEFFLNFGLPDCDFNYESLKDFFGFSFGTQSSCGIRVELNHLKPRRSV